MSTDLLLTVCFTVSLFLWLKNSSSVVHFQPPISKLTLPDWSLRPRSLILSLMGREVGLFSLYATVSRLEKWYHVSLLFIFPWTLKKISGHWKGKVSIPEGKHLHFSSYWETIPQIINRLWSIKSKVSLIKSEISSMDETDFCWSVVVSIKSYSPISGTFLPSDSSVWVLSVVPFYSWGRYCTGSSQAAYVTAFSAAKRATIVVAVFMVF